MERRFLFGRFFLLVFGVHVASGFLQTSTNNRIQEKAMVSLHGKVSLRAARRGIAGTLHSVSEVPPDPNNFLNPEQLEEKAQMVRRV